MSLCNSLGIDKPIIQAPMAGVQNWQLAVAVANAGGLGSIPCGMLTKDQVLSEIVNFKQHSNHHYNLNFFCHDMPEVTPQALQAWEDRLSPYYQSFSVNPPKELSGLRMPFDADMADAIAPYQPPIVSFHFGLPRQDLVNRLKSWGTIIMSSATTCEEGIWLQQNGADVVIAQGAEAGGHRSMFLTSDPATQVPTSELIVNLKNQLSIPVIAAGGIATNRDVKNMIRSGASGVQIGTSYLLCHEAKTTELHKQAIRSKQATTALTNIFSGRLARGITNKVMEDLHFINDKAPAFPYASVALTPLRSKAEALGSSDFSPLWAGENRNGCKEVSASALTTSLWESDDPLN